MHTFPSLKANQVALLRSDVKSGIVLDENLEMAVSDLQVVYTVFDDFDAAITASNELIKDGRIECVIYGKDKAVVRYLSPIRK